VGESKKDEGNRKITF